MQFIIVCIPIWHTHLTQDHPILAITVYMQSQFLDIANFRINNTFRNTQCIEVANNQEAIIRRIVRTPDGRLLVQQFWQYFNSCVVKFIWRMLGIATFKEISVDRNGVG